MSKTEPLPKVYDPKKVEDRWYAFWERSGFFRAEIDESKRPFTIVIPPPNVTGSLHMGHALNNTLQDVLIRFHRMKGYVALWVPGTDHAGIATQNKVEQQLAAEGLTRQQLGREKFIERVWAWKEEYGNAIIGQLKRLGCSCDWSRERFTMDEGYSRAVREVFVRLHEDGLIYRGNRLINWCPRCHTALSDIEVEHHELEGKLWHIRYPLEGSDGYLVIATTRPETMLGDTAIAVHPEDERYRDFIGKAAVLPLIGRRLPIIADEYVDPAFGTGALKVTPAHDPNDFELGVKHGLEKINVLNDDGSINENGGPYAGMSRFEARGRIEADLKKQGLLEKVEEHRHAVGHCYRCHTIIEPYLSDQWFVNMKPLAGPAIEVVEQGKIRFEPAKWGRLYFEWMKDIRDWCVSRQIWWGHQIPAWYCDECDEVMVAREEPQRCASCSSTNLRRDSDVLDTWFSSALWPFAVLGWPDETDDLKFFYPTSVLSTARDILYLWVARMIMTGLKFPKDIPFHTVIIHPTVLNFEGKRMSKSLGTGVDPLELINAYGTDATRFGLMLQVTPLQDMRFTEDKIAMSRNFANKIWNAARFALLNLGDWRPEDSTLPELLSVDDRWILSRLQLVISRTTAALEEFAFGEASRLLYDFFWAEFCDWYLELVKPRLALLGNDSNTARRVILEVLDKVMRLLHPLMPFISEEIWQRLPAGVRGDAPSLMVSEWPTENTELMDKRAEEEIDNVREVASAVRSIRSAFKVAPDVKVEVQISLTEEADIARFQPLAHLIATAARAAHVTVGSGMTRPQSCAAQVTSAATVFVPLAGLVDIENERERLSKEVDKAERELRAVVTKLSNRDFLDKAPESVIAKQKAKRSDLEDMLGRLREQLTWL